MAEKFEYTREWTDANAFPMLGFTKSWENPEDYPTIELDETQVRKDMQSLHDEVKDYINTKLIPAVLAEDATEEARAAAESMRASAEELRASSEQARAEAEQNRASAEQERESAENVRDAAEQTREAAEKARADETSGIVARATEQANLASSAAASAGNSAEAAANSKSAAASSASSAAGSAAAASTSEAKAKASETAAKTSEATAKSEADRAKSEADRAAGIVGGDYATRTDLSAHTDDTDIHVTAEEKAAWDAKLDSFTETDPTVPAWAKSKTKPAYTASEVGAVPTSRTVNGKALSANITLAASDVGAATMTQVNSAIQNAIGNAIGGSY